ncbi:MAG: ABC transporter ATP-binding protein [Planctomycetes bacterium]|nr:ABC transporter ATP-binding protein [Planctomycetota bacterium]
MAEAVVKKPVKLATAWREARELVARNRGRLMLGLVFLLIGRAAGFVLPASSKWLVDEVIANQRWDLLAPMAAAVAGAGLLQAGTDFALAMLLGVAAQKAINDLRKDVHAHVTRLPLRFFDSTQSGVLISRIMTDAEGIRNLVGTGLVQMVGGSLTALVALAILFWVNWELTLAILVGLLVFGGLMAFAFKRLRPMFRQRGKLNAEVTGRLGESLGGIRIVKAYTAESREQAVFAGGIDKLFGLVRSTMLGVSGLGALTSAGIGLASALILLVGGRAIAGGTMTMGDFIFYGFLTGLVAAPMVQMASIGTQITEAFAGLDRIRELRRVVAEDAGDAERIPCPPLKGAVEFRAVSFAYDPGKPVLSDISFVAPAGTTTALVGPSGSGKSTLIGLIMAFQRPGEGAILVDGNDLAGIRLAGYRGQLGAVLQDNFLFDGTIAENIAFARPAASRAEVETAARIARCDDFVRGFDLGYDTIVGERGVKLSGGQRQRVAIARALLADPRILILDEATSSLDSESEAAIQSGLQELRRGRTAFVIAHRLSTIRSADVILVLDGGRIVERGTHDELIALDGRYRQLHDTQYRFERERFVNPGEEHPSTLERPGKPAANRPAQAPS